MTETPLETPPPQPETVTQRWSRWKLAGKIALWIIVVVGAVTVIPVLALRWINPPTSAFMMERRIQGVFIPSERVHIAYDWVDLDHISRNVQLAVMASEDQKFLEHEGFDFDSIEKALAQRHRRSGHLHGASTISQQVAKNLFLWPGRTWVRKGIEAGYTILIETFWDKRRILEVYLNIAEFGDGIYGVGAASPRYFQKPAARLSRHEACLLAAVLPAPKKMHADKPSGYVEGRAWWIERQMMRLGAHHLDPVETAP
ncbi:MAG TPA: monofunctional biosynthetic peptidoglycan transglycosylase [Candidatus Krumholzibacteria bacterium]|nr:monofunctional biosynthetic peptidoglycan transglycosylase [Candidatus Krumholzibacteria bacterium]